MIMKVDDIRNQNAGEHLTKFWISHEYFPNSGPVKRMNNCVAMCGFQVILKCSKDQGRCHNFVSCQADIMPISKIKSY